MFVIYEKALN